MNKLSNKQLLETAPQHQIFLFNLFDETPAHVLLGVAISPFLYAHRAITIRSKKSEADIACQTDLLFSVIKHSKTGGVETSSNYGIKLNVRNKIWPTV